jgi:hypothetical protein
MRNFFWRGSGCKQFKFTTIQEAAVNDDHDDHVSGLRLSV